MERSDITRYNVKQLLPHVRGKSNAERAKTYQYMRLGPVGYLLAIIRESAENGTLQKAIKEIGMAK